MNKLVITKTVINTAVEIGVGILVGGMAKAYTPAKTKLIGKICIGVAGFALTHIVCTKAEDAMNKLVDDIDTIISDVKKGAYNHY